MKKVLFVNPSTGLGGAEKQAIVLATSLTSFYEVHFLCFHFSRSDYQVVELLRGTGVRVHIIESCFPSNYFCRLLRIVQLFFFLLFHRFYCIFPYQYEMNVSIGLLNKILYFNRIIWNQRDEGLGVSRTFINRLAITSYKHFIANSPGGSDFLISTFNIHEEFVSVIPNGVSIKVTKTRDAWRIENGYDNNEFIACMVANIQSNKDHITVLKSWKLLHEEGCECRLLLVGYLGNTYSETAKAVKDFKLEDSVVFTGPCEEMGNLMNACDVSILSSPSEGLSNVMLESMAIGIPFVGTRIKSIESILGCDYPFLFDVGDSVHLASLIKSIFINKDVTIPVIDSNRCIIDSKYTIEKLRDETIKIIEK